MEYWDIVYELIHEINENWETYKDIYVDVYNYEKDEDGILVFGSSTSAKEFASLLKAKIENFPEVKQAVEDAIYDVSDMERRADWWIELAVGGDEYWAYDDEGFYCSECDEWHYYDYYGATAYANYKVYDGWIECEDCIKQDIEHKERYIEDLINNPNNANTILEYKDFLDLDFERVLDRYGDDAIWASGWRGSNDDPKKILARYREIHPNNEYVFSIRKTYDPFECEFELYVREKDEDGNTVVAV